MTQSTSKRAKPAKSAKSNKSKLPESALELNTEQKIKETATRLFMQKGYDATKTRDIADEAGINIALLNYYYRSKENLFDIVSDEAVRSFFGAVLTIMNKPIALDEKIRLYIDTYTEKLLENPQLPLFVMACIQTSPEKLPFHPPLQNNLKGLAEQLRLLAAEGVIRPITVVNFFGTLTSFSIFPFLIRPMLLSNFAFENADGTPKGNAEELQHLPLETLHEMGAAGFRQFVQERKTLIYDMLVAYLFLKK
jgi:AcrR family transcriptional regulator